MAEPPVSDVIDHLAGVAEGSPVAALRRQKPDLVATAQASYDALLEPTDPSGLTLFERHAVGYRVGLLTKMHIVTDWHRARLTQLEPDATKISSVSTYPAGPNKDRRIRAILAHTDKVTRIPGECTADDIEALKTAGLTPGEIVTLSQLLGFLAYQVRAIAVARAFAEESK